MADLENIRNFSIIAHIDHGKSTLADRMLELTGTIEKRKMKEQVLDQMELERERGITIKMQPVRMEHKEHVLNLIDTPGHIDFSYEVSRALKAVEGAILLVDATQGIQAQTLSVLEMARQLGLPIIPVLNKIDLPASRPEEIKEEIIKLLSCSKEEILEVSAKTGEGVGLLLESIIKKIPPPKQEFNESKSFRSLIFDFSYSPHRGVIIYGRVFDGEVKKDDKLFFVASGKEFVASAVGLFLPDETPTEKLSAGEIGFIVTGIKESGVAKVGDTITKKDNPLPALSGYQNPKPVVWASVYPEDQDDFMDLKQGLLRLQLSDSSLSFEEESSGSLGRGFRCGFLGMLHLEIITERLRREFNIELIIASPTISYEVILKNGKKNTIYSAVRFPDDGEYESVFEPMVEVNIITPADYVGQITQLLYNHEAIQEGTQTFGDNRMSLIIKMPLRELMKNFFDELKSASSGFASLSYKILPVEKTDVTRLDILVAEEIVPAFSKIVSKRQMESEARSTVEKLYKLLPRQLFEVKIQAKGSGRIIASKRLSALRKDVTGYLYGGDVTRKKKLLEKQKKGKKKMKQRGKINIPQEVFLKMTKPKD